MHSGEVNDVYHRHLHREKDFLKDRGFSPKHRQSAQEQELSRRKSILIRSESNDLVSVRIELCFKLEIKWQNVKTQEPPRYNH